MESCLCKRTNCPRHGNCEACRAYHHGSGSKPLTRCEKLERKDRHRAERLARREQRKAR